MGGAENPRSAAARVRTDMDSDNARTRNIFVPKEEKVIIQNYTHKMYS